jgi:hypothetical protein
MMLQMALTTAGIFLLIFAAMSSRTLKESRVGVAMRASMLFQQRISI